jgi:hypothetical protein
MKKTNQKFTPVKAEKLEMLKKQYTVNLLEDYAPYFTQLGKSDIIAGMPYGSNVKFSGMKKIGEKVIEFVYGTNPECSTDMVLLGQYTVSGRIFDEFKG